jgi:uncharacterized membrane protein
MRLRARHLILGAITAAAIAVGGAWVAQTAPCVSLTSSGGYLDIAASSIRQGEARFFSYKDDEGAQIRFVLARGENGEIHSAMDACRVCFGYHKGYRSSDGQLVCRFCGNKYELNRMMFGKASCAPISLPHHERGENIRLKASDLVARRAYFATQ